MDKLNYKSSGVNRELGHVFAKWVGTNAKKTHSNKIVKVPSGYASLYKVSKDQLIAASTDGVGTKLKLAFSLRKHDTVGIDLVAMCVNDLICVGAKPLFFLDYFATGKLEPKTAQAVLSGVLKGCSEAESALVGGETAEMPDMYQRGEYDLAGFSVGTVHPKKLITGKQVKAGDCLIGLASSGFHSNGFSLLRQLIRKKSLPKKEKLKILAPTRIYVRSVMPLIEKGIVNGAAHVTGSGLHNVARISDRFDYDVCLPQKKDLPKVYQWLEKQNAITFEEAIQTFNMGIGMVLAVSPEKKAQVLRSLRAKGETAWWIGTVLRRQKKKPQVFVDQEGENSVLLQAKK